MTANNPNLNSEMANLSLKGPMRGMPAPPSSFAPPFSIQKPANLSQPANVVSNAGMYNYPANYNWQMNQHQVQPGMQPNQRPMVSQNQPSVNGVHNGFTNQPNINGAPPSGAVNGSSHHPATTSDGVSSNSNISNYNIQQTTQAPQGGPPIVNGSSYQQRPGMGPGYPSTLTRPQMTPGVVPIQRHSTPPMSQAQPSQRPQTNEAPVQSTPQPQQTAMLNGHPPPAHRPSQPPQPSVQQPSMNPYQQLSCLANALISSMDVELN
ncbi:uncharacterized protein LOC142344960 [Convolutriloba macropyga]|uniref:uncharacterized protein LOC142344960 n=1 Tax=Convolutriloba macropyga TaxID=536237 RepID=UPI003F51E5EF